MAVQLIGAARRLTGARGASRWRGLPFHLLVVAGAVTVVVGCYLPWATFYDGLYQPNGVSGHGRFFIGLAVAAVAASLLAGVRPALPGLRWAVAAAGAIIAAISLSDLWNLRDLLSSPEAVFYFADGGPGLYVVAAGATLLLLAPAAAPGPATMAPVPLALLAGRCAIIAGLALLVPGAYGDYFMHAGASGIEGAGEAHVHVHSGAGHLLSTDHLLTAGGLLLALGGAATSVLTGRRRDLP